MFENFGHKSLKNPFFDQSFYFLSKKNNKIKKNKKIKNKNEKKKSKIISLSKKWASIP